MTFFSSNKVSNRYASSKNGSKAYKKRRNYSFSRVVESLEERVVMSVMVPGAKSKPAIISPSVPSPGPGVGAAPYVKGELLVQYKPQTSSQIRGMNRYAFGVDLKREIRSSSASGVLELIQFPTSVSVESARAWFSRQPDVAFAEPDFLYSTSAVSNDPYYTSGQLWGMYGDDTPTPVGPAGTTNAYGIAAEKAWNQGVTGSKSVFVGVIDTGIQVTHPDLVNNIWVNPYDPVDGIDNDGNGYVDDVNGWDFVNNDNSVYDSVDDDHGTHVAGTIGGKGNNGIGVAGVNWDVTIISAKFLGTNGGTSADAVRAIDYMTDLKNRHGINLVATNNSWGGGSYSQSMHDAIIREAKVDIIFAAAAGNSTSNNDSLDNYPSNYSTLTGTSTESAASFESVIAVASIASDGFISGFSSYGATTVDIGAPGSGIYSSVPTSAYASFNGTSMATPHVAGAIALYASLYPTATANQIRDVLLQTAVPTPSLAGLTVTGGRLNIYDALKISPIPAKVVGRAYSDLNSNNMYDIGEPTYSGVNIYADLNNNGTRNPFEPLATTASDGTYEFTGLPSNTTMVISLLSGSPANSIPVSPANGTQTVNILPNEQANVDFTFLPQNALMGQITDGTNGAGLGRLRVYNDVNNNNLFDHIDKQGSSITQKQRVIDMGIVTKTAVITGLTLPIAGIEVGLNLTHSHVGDLIITLISPDRTSVILLNRNGSNSQNLVNFSFDEYADNQIPVARNLNGTRFIPYESMSKFFGTRPSGTWTVTVQDRAYGDLGVFSNFTIRLITSNEATAVTNSKGFYSIQNASAGMYNLKVESAKDWNFVAPVNGNYTFELKPNKPINGLNYILKKSGSSFAANRI
jgi:subtilisin family serine protease/subtilisin-like proprotein convertase family protein